MTCVTRFVSGSMRDTELSPVLATHTAPAPMAIADGIRAGIAPSIVRRPVLGSIRIDDLLDGLIDAPERTRRRWRAPPARAAAGPRSPATLPATGS